MRGEEGFIVSKSSSEREQRGRQRLIDVALGEASRFAMPGDMTAEILRRLEEGDASATPSRSPQILAAALVLLGLVTTIWIATLQMQESEGKAEEDSGTSQPAGETWQDPSAAELPPPLHIKGTTDIPDGVRNLSLQLFSDMEVDLAPIAELPNLERLEVRGYVPRNPADLLLQRSGVGNPSGLLLPLTKSPRLRTLVLSNEGWKTHHVAELAQMLSLRDLSIVSRGFVLTAEIAKELGRLPLLRSLSLTSAELKLDGMKVLAQNKRLRELSLCETRGVSSALLDSVATMRQLRVLALSGLDSSLLDFLASERSALSGRALTPEFLGQLPDLISLDLSFNRLSADQIRSLPRSLRRLSIRACTILEADLDSALLALPLLDDLTVSLSHRVPKQREDLLVRIIEGKQWRRLHLARRPTAAVMEALSLQKELRTLCLDYLPPPGVRPRRLELGFLGSLPKLTRLELRVKPRVGSGAMPKADLIPLQKVPLLRTLVLRGWSPASVAQIRSLLGEGVRIVL